MSYLVKSILVLTLLYVPYMLMLRKESFFRFNRIMLLSIILLSLILPFVNIPFLYVETQPMEDFRSAIMLDQVIVRPDGAVVANAPTAHPINLRQWITTLYLLGMAVVLIYKLFQLLLLYRSIHHGVLWTERIGRAKLYCHVGQVPPFSWMNAIVISEEDYNHNAATILRHEMEHVRRLHSLDILLVNICQVIQWINPFAWMIANSLRDVHEYEADDTVLRSGVNAAQYQLLLIKKAVGSSPYTFANSFNHSLLKNRITMMLKKKSNPWMRTKALYLIPVAAIALTAFATPVLKNKGVSNLPSEDTTPFVISAEPVDRSMNVVDDSPAVSYETDQVVSQPNSTAEGAGFVTELNTEEIQTPKLANSKVKGDLDFEPVPVDTLEPYNLNDKGEKIYSVPEALPVFEGGTQGLMQFLQINMKYPQLAHECGVQATILITFIVNQDGSCSDFEVAKILPKPTAMEIRKNEAPEVVVTSYTKKEGDKQYLTQAEYDASLEAITEEALRVCQMMPKWTPGYVKGEPVKTHFTIPISFRLR